FVGSQKHGRPPVRLSAWSGGSGSIKGVGLHYSAGPRFHYAKVRRIREFTAQNPRKNRRSAMDVRNLGQRLCVVLPASKLVEILPDAYRSFLGQVRRALGGTARLGVAARQLLKVRTQAGQQSAQA